MACTIHIEVENDSGGSQYFVPDGGTGYCISAVGVRKSGGTISEIQFSDANDNIFESGGTDRFWSPTAYDADGTGAALVIVTATCYLGDGTVLWSVQN